VRLVATRGVELGQRSIYSLGPCSASPQRAATRPCAIVSSEAVREVNATELDEVSAQFRTMHADAAAQIEGLIHSLSTSDAEAIVTTAYQLECAANDITELARFLKAQSRRAVPC